MLRRKMFGKVTPARKIARGNSERVAFVMITVLLPFARA
jgi:hypothetical protein